MKDNSTIVKDENLISYCGLYCGACPRYLKGKCEGCQSNNPSWCKIKPCNLENDFSSCAECTIVGSVADCKKFNPLLIRVGEFVSKTSRKNGIELIQKEGRQAFVDYMVENKLVSMKR